MRIAKIELQGQTRLAVVEEGGLRLLKYAGAGALTSLLHAADPVGHAKSLLEETPLVPVGQYRLLAPIDRQEVWAAGVTYKRSQVARMEESETGASHYDRVYTAARPELFFKATPNRVAHPGEPVRIRTDTKWSVPEPEFTLIMTPEMKLVAYTIGNDMSARDIEGENPLYLPQAKVYDRCCALGPYVQLIEGPLERERTIVRLTISRAGKSVFAGETNLGQLARTFEDLISWLGRDSEYPDGVYLLTGTGVVPPNEFTLQAGDHVAIEISGIGTLENPVIQG